VTETLTLPPLTLTVEDTLGVSRDGRPVFRWTARHDDGRTWTAPDLHGAVLYGQPEPSEHDMLGTLLAFLQHDVDRLEYRSLQPEHENVRHLRALLDLTGGSMDHVPDLAIAGQCMDLEGADPLMFPINMLEELYSGDIETARMEWWAE